MLWESEWVKATIPGPEGMRACVSLLVNSDGIHGSSQLGRMGDVLPFAYSGSDKFIGPFA